MRALKDLDLRVIVGYSSKSIPIEGTLMIKGLGKGRVKVKKD